METKEYHKLVEWYGTDLANQARDWFIENHTTAFRACVRQAEYCRTNEYLWR